MPRDARRAFTLLELILVMMIIATVMALAAPSLSGWSKGAKLRNAAESLVSMTRYARTQAIIKGTVYRVQLGDPATFTLLKQQGTDFVEANDQAAPAVAAPDGGKIEFTRITVNSNEQTQPDTGTKDAASSDASRALDFDPTGRSPTATIKIYDSAGKYLTIENTSPLQQFKTVSNAS